MRDSRLSVVAHALLRTALARSRDRNTESLEVFHQVIKVILTTSYFPVAVISVLVFEHPLRRNLYINMLLNESLRREGCRNNLFSL